MSGNLFLCSKLSFHCKIQFPDYIVSIYLCWRMRIGHNFDTQSDSNRFLRYEQEFGVGKVILIKRHPLFLIRAVPYILICFAIFALALQQTMRWNLHTAPILFYSFLVVLSGTFVFWVVTLVQELFLNVSPHLRNYFHAQEVLQQQQLRTHKIMLLLSVWLITTILFVVLIVLWWSGAGSATSGGVGLQILHIISQLVLVYATRNVISLYIDYELDNIFITPEFIEMVDQTNFFSQRSNIIRSDQIKVLEVRKKGIISTIMNVGKVVCLWESFYGDRKILSTFTYVADPESLIHHIQDTVLHAILLPVEQDKKLS